MIDQNIRKKQETEIEQLDKTARQLRTEFSQKVNQLKEDLLQMANDLDRVGRIQLKQSRNDARQVSPCHGQLAYSGWFEFQ
ncbi:unnamed protein product [Echinostoma caproni]|uniref:t-SNARE coiled-coil homology domain-containing protein n=1 Tax=Echinostoma caproni TaxID=27848 RepID=A0A183A441_9TREM|nr:unnamed protein product [Echinostoma caproni]